MGPDHRVIPEHERGSWERLGVTCCVRRGGTHSALVYDLDLHHDRRVSLQGGDVPRA